MAQASVTPEGLTLNEEAFALQVASGASYSEAWRSCHPSSLATDKTIWEEASHMAARPKVQARIHSLLSNIQAAAVAEIAWDKVRLVKEAAENLQLARTGGWRGVGSANGALEIIGRATGLLSDSSRGNSDVVRVTQVTIVTSDPGAGSRGGRVVDVMPVVQAPEDTAEPHQQLPKVT